MPAAVDMTGKKYGRLTVLGRDYTIIHTHAHWRCLCECGNEVTIRGTSIRQGDYVSCGCYRRDRGADMMTKHEMYYHPSYQTWNHMMTRCYNEKCEDYPDYGGRGIEVCERWHDVRLFCEDMGERPKGLSIDRIDVNGNYEPSNCRWATDEIQVNNRRNSTAIEFEGKTYTNSQLARKLNIKPQDLHYYLFNRKLEVREAIGRCKPIVK